MISPPTDSLYKFIAIFGLIIFTWGVAFPWQKTQEFKLKLVEIKSEIKINKDKAKQLNVNYQLLIEKRKLIKHSDPESELKKAAIDNKKQEIYIQLIEADQPVDGKIEVLKVINEALNVYKILGWLSICFGLFLIIFGFLLWYNKLQKHIDIKLQKDANKAT